MYTQTHALSVTHTMLHNAALKCNLHSIWGVAEATAERWYAAGLRTLEDVASNAGSLKLTVIQVRHILGWVAT
jgi:hypothetical protein